MLQNIVVRKKRFYERYIKRLLDIILSLAAIIIFSPLLLIIWCLVRFKLGSPVLFIQDRTGKNGIAFHLYKFRTMTNERDEHEQLLSDEQRLTNFGKKLRSTSLDELPELFNILSGDMSIVGPRPLLVKYLPLYNKEQLRRHEIRPGLTGFAQIHGRNAVSWEERFKFDVEYVDNVTFLNDWKIIFDTVALVLKRKGISGENSVTMSEFKGNDHEI